MIENSFEMQIEAINKRHIEEKDFKTSKLYQFKKLPGKNNTEKTIALLHNIGLGPYEIKCVVRVSYATVVRRINEGFHM